MFGHFLSSFLMCSIIRSSEFSDSDAKAAIDLLRLQKTVETIKVCLLFKTNDKERHECLFQKGERRQSQFFWDDVTNNGNESVDQEQ